MGFWKYGYEGASYEVLCAETGLTPPQIYAAFGNKEELFKKTFAAYLQDETGFFTELAAAEKPVSEWLPEVIGRFAEFYTDAAKPKGCLSTAATFSLTEENHSILATVKAGRRQREKLFAEKFRQAKRKGELTASVDPAAGRFIMALLHGMSIQARDGKSLRELKSYADFAVRSVLGESKTGLIR